MAQFVDTNQGGKTLHFEGYIYTKIQRETAWLYERKTTYQTQLRPPLN